jgi:hypothetical protein
MLCPLLPRVPNVLLAKCGKVHTFDIIDDYFLRAVPDRPTGKKTNRFVFFDVRVA